MYFINLSCIKKNSWSLLKIQKVCQSGTFFKEDLDQESSFGDHLLLILGFFRFSQGNLGSGFLGQSKLNFILCWWWYISEDLCRRRPFWSASFRKGTCGSSSKVTYDLDFNIVFICFSASLSPRVCHLYWFVPCPSVSLGISRFPHWGPHKSYTSPYIEQRGMKIFASLQIGLSSTSRHLHSIPQLSQKPCNIQWSFPKDNYMKHVGKIFI